MQGYYAQSAGRGQDSGLQGQIDRIIEQAGGQVNELRSSRTFTSADIRRRTSSNCLLAVMSPTVASQSSLLW